MLNALLIGSAMMIGSLAAAIFFFGVAARVLRWLEETQAFGYRQFTNLFELVVTFIWILFVLSFSVWGWAALYMSLDLFDGLRGLDSTRISGLS